MSHFERVRLYDLLAYYPVDKRTLKGAVSRAGFRIFCVGDKAGPFISKTDFETIKNEGLEYRGDRIPPEKIP